MALRKNLALGLLLLATGAHAGSILDQLREKDIPLAQRLNFSGSTDARYVDGESALTPFNFNNQTDTGGIGTFTLLRIHLFLDAQISKRTSLFVKIGGGTADAARVVVDAVAVTTKLGLDLPDLEVGRFLSNFGRFSQRFLGPDNPLIADPLIYSYVTNLSTTQVPSNTLDLLNNRGRGLASRFTGYAAGTRGFAIQSNVWYFNGLKVVGALEDFDLTYSAALVNDAISSADFLDPNDDKTVTLNARWAPSPDWKVGLSYSHGAYLQRGIIANPIANAVDVGDFAQDAYGLDFEYAHGAFGVFAELVHSSWESPFIGPELEVTGFFIEPRYKLMPGLSFVARYDNLNFHDIATPLGNQPWEFDVFRLECGFKYSIERDLMTKVTYQFNVTDDAPSDPHDDVLNFQLVSVF